MSAARADAAPRRLSVVIADDSSAIRSSLSALITKVPGVEVVGVAETGAEALAMIRTLKPDFATLDIRMPELNGLEVLGALRKEGLQTSIIVLTGLAELEYRRKCIELGAKHCFHKATEFEKVLEILKEQARQLSGSGSGNSPGTAK